MKFSKISNPRMKTNKQASKQKKQAIELDGTPLVMG